MKLGAWGVGQFVRFAQFVGGAAQVEFALVMVGIPAHCRKARMALRARKLIVRVSGANSTEVSADVAALQGFGKGNASISARTSRATDVTFDGTVDLTFAFRAYELGYVDGNWTVTGDAERDQFLSSGAQVMRLGDRPIVIKSTR